MKQCFVLCIYYFALVTHPLRSRHSHALFESSVKSAVGAESTLVSQLLNRYGLMDGGSLMVEVDEVTDAQPVDIGIVGGTLIGKVLAEIDTVDTYLLGELGEGDVVLQIELRFLAVPPQQRPDVVTNGA